jgi:hypothetical protein
MVLKPIEIFENSRDHSVLIIDNFREEAAFWNGRELSDIRDIDLKRVFSVLKLQSHKVCRGLIGKQYVHGKFDDISESSLLILVFENNSRVFELRSKKIPWQRLRGFTACKVTRSKVIIDLVCATFPRLGTELINYVLRYADKYKKLNVHLDAATIELACKFYPRFGFKFTEKEKKARHDKRCLSDGTVDSSGLADSKMFKMLRTIKRNTMSQSQRSRAVASRTRAANTIKRATEYRTPGTRRSKRKSRGTTTRYSGFETKLPHMRRNSSNSSSSNSRLSNIPE